MENKRFPFYRLQAMCLKILLITSVLACDEAKTKKAAPVTDPESIVNPPVAFERKEVDTLPFIKDTVLAIGSYHLRISKTDSVVLPEIYMDAAQRRQVEAAYDNFYEAARATEDYLQQTQGAYFSRSADTLILNLHDGKQLTLVNKQGDGDDVELYTYEHYFPHPDAFLVKVQYYEGDSYLLVNRASGSRKFIIGGAHPAPGGRKLLAINDDLEARYSPNGLQLIGKSGDDFITLFTIEAGNWAPVGVKWLNDTSLILKVKIMQEDFVESTFSYYRFAF